MARFQAGGILESLDYDFSDLPEVPALADVKGTIREPTAAQVRAFNVAAQAEVKRLAAELAKAGPDAELPGVAGLADVLEVFAYRSVSLTPEAVKRQAEMLSALCSGHPTAAQLQKLPYRIMAEFARWVTKEVMDPEARTGDGGAQVVPLRSSSAG